MGKVIARFGNSQVLVDGRADVRAHQAVSFFIVRASSQLVRNTLGSVKILVRLVLILNRDINVNGSGIVLTRQHVIQKIGIVLFTVRKKLCLDGRIIHRGLQISRAVDKAQIVVGQIVFRKPGKICIKVAAKASLILALIDQILDLLLHVIVNIFALGFYKQILTARQNGIICLEVFQHQLFQLATVLFGLGCVLPDALAVLVLQHLFVGRGHKAQLLVIDIVSVARTNHAHFLLSALHRLDLARAAR